MRYVNCLLACALLLGARPSVGAPETPAPPVPQHVAGAVWLIAGGFPPGRQPDGNTIVFAGRNGLVVMDTGRHPWHTMAIRDFAVSRHEPIVAIVNSHWHLDHVSGNPSLKSAYPGAVVYASNAIDDALKGFLRTSAEGARQYLKTPNLPGATVSDIQLDLQTMSHGDALRPDKVVTGETTIAIPGLKIELELSPDAATAGDVWVYDPGVQLVASGDLVTLPVPFLDTACVDGWREALTRISEMPFHTLIPGHGKPMDRRGFARYREAFDTFTACAASNRPSADCADDWTRDVAPLLAHNDMAPARAKAMATYYVDQVLRPNGGNSAWCRKTTQ